MQTVISHMTKTIISHMTDTAIGHMTPGIVTGGQTNIVERRKAVVVEIEVGILGYRDEVFVDDFLESLFEVGDGGGGHVMGLMGLMGLVR